MQIAMVGLGRMGGNMARRLMKGGHDCVVYDRDPHAVAELVAEGATGTASLRELVQKLLPPRVTWIMVPAGEITENTVTELAGYCTAGDIIVDGGNSYFKDDVRRAKVLAERSIRYVDAGYCTAGDIIVDGGNSYFKDDVRRAKVLGERGVRYLDAGTSGGVWGLERGYCLMVGGDVAAVNHLEPVLRTLAPGGSGIAPSPGRTSGGSAEQGWLHCGPPGAGHFVKMVHNGIEYGLMQAYAEGFDILRNAGAETLPAGQRYELDLADIAELWRRGSVVTSWLLDLSAEALAHDPELSAYTGFVQDSGEGRWTVQAAIDEAVPADVLTSALYTRFRSRREHTFAEKMLSAMRQGFGGHKEPTGK